MGLLPAHIGNAESELVYALRPHPELTEPFTLLVHPDLRKTPRVRAVLDFFAAEAGTIRSLFRADARET